MTLKPYLLNVTKNISLPIGTILAVQKYSAKLNFSTNENENNQIIDSIKEPSKSFD